MLALDGFGDLSALGTGGSAEVLAGRRARDGARVALKIYRTGGAADRARAGREAALLERVGPDLCPALLERGEIEVSGRPYLVLELIDGRPLNHADLSTAPIEQRLEALARAAAAIDEIHARGVVHRDLKPAHLLVEGAGRVRVLDLGTARALDGAGGADAMSDADALMGTPRYMAPEQCTGAPVGPAADRYAFAVVAFELLLGRPPFLGQRGELVAAHAAARPPALAGSAGLPAAVDQVLATGLAKDPADRPPSAAALVRALEAACRAPAEAPVSGHPPTDRVDGSPAAAGSATRVLALLALDSAAPLPELAQVVGEATIARAHGARTVIAVTDAASPAASILGALTLAARLAGLARTPIVVHAAPLTVARRGARVLVAGPALEDLAWADVAAPAASAPAASALDPGAGPLLTRDAAGLLSPLATRPAGPRLARLVAADPPPWPPTVRGRDALLDALEQDASRGGPALVTIFGGDGAGKTRVLELLADRLAARGLVTRFIAGPSLRPGAALADAVAEKAVPLPAALLIDDLDRADSSVLAAIERVAAGSEPWRPWICGAARPELLAARPQWDATAARQARHTLAPLGDADAAALVRELVRPAELVPDAVVARVVAAGAGVPLHLVELATGLRTGALCARDGLEGVSLAADALMIEGATPLGRRLARRALAGAPPALAALAALVAVLGDGASTADVAAAQRHLDGEGGIDAAVGLDRLAGRGLLRARDGLWWFAHPMVGRGLSDALSPDERRRYHAAALAAERARSAPRLSRLARHAALAGDPAAAGAWMSLARSHAARGAHVEAQQAWQSAFAELPAGDPRRAAALAGRGRALYRLQRLDESLAVLAEAERAARAAGDGDTTLDVLLDRATVLDWTMRWSESREAAEAAAALLRERTPGGSEVPARGVVAAARVDLALGRARFRGDDLAGGIALLERAADRARPASDAGDETAVETRTIALLMLAALLVYGDRLDDAERRFAEAVDLCQRVGDEVHTAATLINRRLLWLRRGDIDRAAADQERAIALARALGAPQVERLACLNLAETLYWQGQLGDARRAAERALALQRRFSGDDDLTDDALLLARIHLGRGDLAAAAAARALVRAPRDAKARALCAMVDLELEGAPPPAWAAVEPAITGAAPYAELKLEFWLLAARRALATGARTDARAWLERAALTAPDGSAWHARIAELARAAAM